MLKFARLQGSPSTPWAPPPRVIEAASAESAEALEVGAEDKGDTVADSAAEANVDEEEGNEVQPETNAADVDTHGTAVDGELWLPRPQVYNTHMPPPAFSVHPTVGDVLRNKILPPLGNYLLRRLEQLASVV